MESILIPVKRFEEAKRRLAARLGAEERRRLGLAMLADVLRATDKWEARWIVTSDRDAEAVGLAFGCRLISDSGMGLNVAIEEGTRRVLGEGADSLLVLPSDVPLVSADDVTILFALDVPVAICPSGNGGTNALLRRPPDAISASFGPGSAVAHASAAAAKGLDVRTLNLPSLVLDIDEHQDLQSLAGTESERESVRVARALA